MTGVIECTCLEAGCGVRYTVPDQWDVDGYRIPGPAPYVPVHFRPGEPDWACPASGKSMATMYVGKPRRVQK